MYDLKERCIIINIELFFRLVVSVILGGIIGLERGGTKHAAGLRTHTILCLGAASVMVVSEFLVEKYNIPQEIMRMGAQIISGVGFLGAGSIIMNGGQLHGITTAAGLWTTACVGIAVGSGNYLIAIFVVALMMVVMLGLRSLSQKIRTECIKYTIMVQTEKVENISSIFNEIVENGMEICNVKIKYDNEENYLIQIDINSSQKIFPENFHEKFANCAKLKEFTLKS